MCKYPNFIIEFYYGDELKKAVYTDVEIKELALTIAFIKLMKSEKIKANNYKIHDLKNYIIYKGDF